MPSHKDPRSQRIPVRDIEVHYTRSGVGSPLILLHGGGGSHANWDEHLRFLNPEFDVIVPDLRGHGASTNSRSGLQYGQMADDIAALADALEIAAPSVCGWSDGGQVALELALRYGSRFGALVLGGVQIERTPESVEKLTASGLLPHGEIDTDKIQLALPEWLEIVKATHQQSGDHWLNLLRDLSQLYHSELEYPDKVLGSSASPILVVLGDRDQFIRVEHAVRLYRALPNAELAVFPNGDHAVSRKEPEKFCRVVGEFLRRHSAGKTSD